MGVPSQVWLPSLHEKLINNLPSSFRQFLLQSMPHGGRVPFQTKAGLHRFPIIIGLVWYENRFTFHRKHHSDHDIHCHRPNRLHTDHKHLNKEGQNSVGIGFEPFLTRFHKELYGLLDDSLCFGHGISGFHKTRDGGLITGGDTTIGTGIQIIQINLFDFFGVRC